MNNLRSAKTLQVGQQVKVPHDRTSAAVAVAKAQVPHPPLSKKMTTTAGVVAAKEAGQAAARAASAAAGTAVAAVPAAVIQPEEAPSAEAARPAAPAEPAVVEAAAGNAEVATKVAAATAEPTKAQPAAEEPQPVLTAEHKVGRGQTLSQIAAMYRTSVDDLKAMNDIADARSIQPGQVLKVKASGSEIVAGATVGRTYKAKSGDTLWTIAKSNDTSVETIKRLNPNVASKGLRIGDVIKVPSAGAVSVASRAVASDKPVAKKTTAKKVESAKASTKTIAKAPPKAAFRSHRVEKGQTLTSIAQRYKTSVDALKRINNIRDAKSVQAGKTLKVPL
jgi:LysM repeat protein